MKVLLCQSFTGLNEPVIYPIGLAYIAANLSQHDLVCWDTNIFPNNYLDKLTGILESYEPEIIGLSLRNVDNPMHAQRSYFSYFVEIVRKFKEIIPSCKLVVGGPGFSIFAEEVMRLLPEIDFGVFSEGEQTFPDLLDNLNHPERVKGLFVRQGPDVMFTGKREFVDFASLIPPSRNAFDITNYTGKASVGIQTKRGCKFNCIYCLHKFYMGNRYRARNPKLVVDEIEMLADKYKVASFYFNDPVFNFPFEHAREICREIIKRRININWEASFRPDFLNRSFVFEALKAGCEFFDFSPDGASDNSLEILGKNMGVSSIAKSVDLVHDIEGAKVAYEFMSAVPGDNAEHVRGLLNLVPKILIQCREKLKYLSISKMRIYPNTRLHEIALNEGKISKETDLLRPIHYENKSVHKIEALIVTMLRLSSGSSCTLNRLFNCVNGSTNLN